MVVDENAKSSGKGNSASKFLVDGVAAAILTLGAAQAFATDWDITGPTTTPLTLNDGDSVAIQIGGSINTGALLNTPAISNTIGATIGYINNMGTVSSVGSSNSANAIDLIGGTISGGISNAGSIFGGFNGISVSNNARVIGPIINSGTITGTGVRANGVGFYGNYPDAIGAYATVAGSIVNTGLIQAISSESLAAGLYFEANGTTSIGNAQFGNISNEGLIDGRGASLAGAGSFAGDGFGIEIRSVNLVNMEGSHQSLQNSGTLSGIGGSVEGLNSSGGNGYGFDIHSGSLSNWFIPGSSIQNNGLILGLGGSALNDSSIAGSGFGVNVSTGSIGINHPTSSGAISNNNLIEGVGGDATGVSAIAGAGYGMNLSTASIGAWSGPSIANPTVAGGIVNSGTILGRGGVASGSMGTSGIGVGIALSNSTTNNGLINSGLIQGIGGSALSFAGAGIGIQASESFLVGGIENRGTIQGLGGSSSGISSAAAGDGQGLVIGANSLLYGLSNSGLIQGVGGISLGSSVSAGLGHGIALSSSIIVGDVSNSGTIQGMGGNTSGTSASSGAGKGLLVTNGSQATSFINSGLIIGSGGNSSISTLNTGVGYGFEISNSSITGGINNSGTIQGIGGNYASLRTARGYGIFIGADANIAGGITNSGLISGNTNAIYVDSTATVSRINVSGNNSARFDGSIYAPNTGLYVTSGSTFTLSSSSPYIVREFYNEGTIVLNPGSPSTIAGLTSNGLFTQAIDGSMEVVVRGTQSGAYGSLYIDGSASVAGSINLNFLSSSYGISSGSTIAGVLIDTAGITSSGLNVTSNSVLLTFSGQIIGNQLDIVALGTNAGVCAGTVAVNSTGPCLVGFDSPSLVVNSGVTISGGNAGIRVLTGFSDGANASGFGINNQGHVQGYPFGIELQSGATLSGGITNAGVIGGGTDGVYLRNAKLVGPFQNSGVINPIYQGIILENSSIVGGLNNSGLITGINAAVNLSGSYVEDITNTGTISSSGNAFYLVNGSTVNGQFLNSGSIQGDPVGYGGGRGLLLSQSALNGDFINAGKISGNTAVELYQSNLIGTVANSGTLSGVSNGLYISGSSIAGSMINAGSVAGASAIVIASSSLGAVNNSGTLSGAGYGLYIAGSSVAGSLINAGSVAGALAIVIASSSLGAVNNSGTLSGTDYGLYIVGSSIAGFINSGLIIGVNNNSYSYSSDEQVYVGGDSGYGLFAVNNIILGSYSNSGLIQGFGRAENIEATVNGSSVTGRASLEVYSGSGIGAMFYDGFSEGGLINTGSVIGVAGNNNIQGVLAQPIDPSLLDGGLDVFATGGIGLGIGVQGSTSAGSINNQGLIEGVGGNVSTNVTYINSSLSTSLSHLADGGGGTGVRFIYSDLSEVVNSGIIRGVGGSSQAMITESASYASTNLRVQGGDGVGLDITDSLINRNFENSGLIEGWGGSAAASNTSTTVQGGIGAGVRLNSLNYTDSPVFVDTTIVGSIINSGTIQGFGGSVSGGALANGGDGFGMLLGGFDTTTSLTGGVIVSQGITNSGLLQGNSGLAAGADAISGNGYGVFITSNSVVERGIRNSGTITGNSAAGLYLSNATINGGINNIGLIGGGNQGIAINESSLVTGGINNSGTISGRLHSIYLDNSSILSGGINIAGTSAALIGDLSASTSTLNIQSGAIFGNTNSINVGSLNIESGAIFNLSQGSSTTYGSAIAGALSIASGVQVTDSVRNAGTLAVIAGQSPTITGDYQQETRGIYQTQLVSANNYGKFNVTGTATLNTGSVINVNVVNTPYIANQTTLSGILNAGSLTAGSVSNVTVTDDSNWLEFAASSASNPNSLDLIVTQSLNMVTAVEQNNNPSAIGSATVLQGFAVNPSATMQGVVTRLYEQPTTLAVSNAISQTVPVLVGAGSLIAAQTQQNLNQIMQGRQNQLRGLSSGEEFIGNRHAWMRGFGSWASQGDVNNVSGYKVNTGGLAIGIDHELSPKANIGAVFAFANSSVNSNSSAAPSSMTINSYQLGAYGDYSLRQNLQINYQLDFGLNNNKESRNLSAFNGVPGVSSSSGSVNANGNYNSYVGHLGVGLRQFYPMAHKTTTLIPSVRADYTTVQSSSYTETGAGSLNLSANSQTYNMMVLAADMRVDHMLSDKLKLSANLGGGYNTLNNQVQMVTAFQGGGPAFTTNGLQTSPWLYGAGLGLSGRVSKEIELNVRYDTQFSSSSYNNQMVSAKLKFFY